MIIAVWATIRTEKLKTGEDKLTMALRLLVFCGLTAIATGTYASSIDLNIHEEAVRLTYATEVGSAVKGLEFEAGLLYHEDNDDVIHVGLQVSGENWSEAGTFDISIGGRFVASEQDPGDALAVGLGGRVRFSPVHRLGLGVYGYYAPEILSFVEATQYVETGAFIDYQLLPQAFVYAGYRHLEFEFDDGPDVTVDASGHLGLKLVF